MIPPVEVNAQTQIDMSDSCNCSSICCIPGRRVKHKKNCPEHKKIADQFEKSVSEPELES